MRTLLFLFVALAAAAYGQEKKLSREEAMSLAVTKVQPEYPAMAKQLKIEGQVEVEAVLAEDGAVEKVNIVSGNPVLTRPAADALKRWKFSPATANGKAVRAVAPILFTFKK